MTPYVFCYYNAALTAILYCMMLRPDPYVHPRVKPDPPPIVRVYKPRWWL